MADGLVLCVEKGGWYPTRTWYNLYRVVEVFHMLVMEFFFKRTEYFGFINCLMFTVRSYSVHSWTTWKRNVNNECEKYKILRKLRLLLYTPKISCSMITKSTDLPFAHTSHSTSSSVSTTVWAQRYSSNGRNIRNFKKSLHRNFEEYVYKYGDKKFIKSKYLFFHQ